MKPHERILLIILGLLLAGTGAGLVVTSDWGSRPVSSGGPQSPVDMHQMQTAMALAPLAVSAEEQERARDALRLADHEVDMEFAAALREATSQPVPSTPEIRAILERISKAKKSVAEIDAGVARITKLLEAATANQRQALAQQLELAKARLELNEDELADANQDLERAGGDPQSRIQRMVDDHNAAEQDSNGHLDLSGVGKQAGSTLPVSNSFFPRARAWYALHSFVGRLGQAEQEANTKAATFSSRHDDLGRQLEQAQAQQSKKLADSASAKAPGGALGGAPSSTSDQTDAAISSYRSLTALQNRMSGLDSRIRNQQDLAGVYGRWSALAASRERGLLHSLFLSFGWILLIALAVAHLAARVAGAILILLVIFGFPDQMATVLALAGASLTVALKDFIVGFFGWFVLMGKNGIRHGDWVEINGVSGEVIEIGLFHTVLFETGNWNDSGYPTGRRVTFVNSYAIEGHYFNFSTSGQWLWDELQIALPADQDPYPIVDELQKIVTKETETNARLAEQEWARLGNLRGTPSFSAGPAISVRPSNLGFEILVRYVTRANERHKQRSNLYHEIIELLRRRNIPQPAQPPAAPSAAAESA